MSIVDLTCDDLRQRLRACEAFSILSCIFIFVATVLAAARLFKGTLRIPASGVALFGSVCQLITWAVGANIFNSGFSDATSPRSAGYSVGPGLALYVTAWCITVVFSIVNIILE